MSDPWVSDFYDFWDRHEDYFLHDDIVSLVYSQGKNTVYSDSEESYNIRDYENRIKDLLIEDYGEEADFYRASLELDELFGKKLSQQQLLNVIKSAAKKKAKRTGKVFVNTNLVSKPTKTPIKNKINKAKLKAAEAECAQKCAEVKRIKAAIKVAEKVRAVAKRKANQAAKKALAQAKKEANQAAKKAAKEAKQKQ